jgi:hypothetical protein
VGSLILFLATTAFAYLVDAVLVGVLLYVLRSRFSLRFSKISGPLALSAIFAFLDLYWIPAAMALDVRFRILNQVIADLLGLSEEIAVVELFGFGWFDLCLGVASLSSGLGGR